MMRRQLEVPRLRGVAVLATSLLVSLACAGWPGARASSASESTSTGSEAEEPISPIELRFRLQRFADGLTEALAQPLDRLLANEPDIAKRKIILEAKYAYSSNLIFIASGPYPSVSLLDMVVFVSLLRASIEREGSSIVGEAIGPITRVARKYEREVWELSGLMLSSQQQEELRGLIETWLAANADRGYSEAVRFGEFASELQGVEARRARGLLSEIRNAAATADQALELAERMTYFFQRAPAIWRLHGQLGFFEVMSQPEMLELLANGSSIAASTDRLSNTVSELSALLTSGPSPEQEVLFSNLRSAETSLVQVMVEARDTMKVANELAGTVEVLADRFDVGGSSADGKPDGKPFEIAEYQEAALQLASTASEFSSMIDTLNRLLASPLVADQLPDVAAAAEVEGTRVLRKTVWLIAGSVVVSFCAMLAALFVYRVLVSRLTTDSSS